MPLNDPSQGAGVQEVTWPAGSGLTEGRVDQGVDWSGSGPLLATGAGTIVDVQQNDSGWEGGSFIGLLLSNPPDPTHDLVYYAEDLLPGVTTGQQVNAGDIIAQATGGESGVEIGFGNPNSLGQPLNQVTVGPYAGSGPTPEGQNFLAYITSGSPGGAGAVGATSSGGATGSTGSSGTSSGPSVQGSATPLQGPANLLQGLDNLMNPKSPGALETILSLGTANVSQIAQVIAFRGFFVLGFAMVTYLGFKTLTSPGSSSVLDRLENQQTESRLRGQAATAELGEQRRQLALGGSSAS